MIIFVLLWMFQLALVGLKRGSQFNSPGPQLKAVGKETLHNTNTSGIRNGVTATQHFSVIAWCKSHTSWGSVIRKLKDIGYEPAEVFKVCIGEDHVTLVYDELCPNCQQRKCDCRDYYVLGIKVQDIFKSVQSIKEHMAHWVISPLFPTIISSIRHLILSTL